MLSKRYGLTAALFFAFALLIGCGGANDSQSNSSTSGTTTYTPTLTIATNGSSVTAGNTLSFTVTATDNKGNTETGYSGTVSFASSDSSAKLPSSSKLTNGVGVFTTTFYTAGSQTVTASDSTGALQAGTSPTIAVNAASVSSLWMTEPSSVVDAASFTFTVVAYDTYSNIATSYSGPVTFTSTDAKASLPSSSSLTDGVGSFTATLNTTGSQTITATDANTATLKVVSSTISVTGGAVSKLSVSAPSTSKAGAAVTYVVTALDANGNTASNYSGAVAFASTDAKASLPSSSSLSSGVGSFSATLNTAGSQTITASDVSTPTITGTSSAIAVSPGSASALTLATPKAALIGSAATFTVAAYDTEGNLATNYTGPISLSSTDSSATFSPSSASLLNGSGSFKVTFETSGSQTITASDANSTSPQGTSGEITVVATKPTLTASSAPQGMVGLPYAYSNFSVSGGATPYTYSYQNAPSGLSLSSSDKRSLVGTPETAAIGATAVLLTVTDLVGNSDNATFSIPIIKTTVATKNSALQGQYLCSVEQYVDTPKTTPGGEYLYRGGLVFSMTATGSGGLTINEGDGNSPVNGYYSISGGSGSYVIGSDYRGYVQLSNALGTASLFAVAGGNLSSGVFQELSLTEMDDAGASPSGTHGSGHCYIQSASLSGVSLNGLAYVFSGRGEDNVGYAEATVGQHLFTAVSGSTGYTVTLTQDLVDGAAQDANSTSVFTASSVDAYGRVALTDSNGSLAQVIYLAGKPTTYSNSNFGALMVAYPHSSSSTQDFYLAQMRQQKVSAISSGPGSGDVILYASGAAYCPSGATTCTASSTPHYRARIMHMLTSSSKGSFWTYSEVKNIDGVSVLDPYPDPEGFIWYDPYTGWIPWEGPSSNGRMIWYRDDNETATDYFYMYFVDSTVSAVLVSGADPTTTKVGTILANNPDPDNSTTTEYLQGLNGWIEQQKPTSMTWYPNYYSANYFVTSYPNGNYSGKTLSATVAVKLDSGGDYEDFTAYAQDSSAALWASWGAGVDDSSVTTAQGALHPAGVYIADGTEYGLLDVTVTGSTESNPNLECYGIHQGSSIGNGYLGRMACIDIYTRTPTITLFQE